jgi:hypothetical protein
LINNKKIHNIYVICNDKLDLNDPKLIRINYDKQPTYRYIFNLINQVTTDNDINMILNSDCFIDESNLELIINTIDNNDVYCLTRWDIKNLNPFDSEFFGLECSQDAWIFKGKISDKMSGDYGMGIPGCDNAIAYEFYINGYNVSNPSKDIKIYHYHYSNIRTYGNEESEKEKNRIKLPYKFIFPHFINEEVKFSNEFVPIQTSLPINLEKEELTTKEFYENYIKDYTTKKENFQILYRNNEIFNSTKQSINILKFEENNFTIDKYSFSYMGVRIKKI